MSREVVENWIEIFSANLEILRSSWEFAKNINNDYFTWEEEVAM